jgi:hypothetical protein
MSSGGRKHVFIYSVQHTGTWFLIRFFLSLFERDARRQHGDQWFRRHTERDINTDNIYLSRKAIDYNFFYKYGERYMDQESLKKVKLLVLHGHHNRPGGDFLSTIKDYKPNIPLFIPMRDPLLAINSKLWREYKSWGEINKWETKEDRVARARQFVDCLLDMLQIPKDHASLIPIDLNATKEDSRLGEKLCQQAGLELNEPGKEYLKGWKQQNETGTRENIKETFMTIKEAYQKQNRAILYNFLGPEIDYLNTRKDLIFELTQIGYNLIWLKE